MKYTIALITTLFATTAIADNNGNNGNCVFKCNGGLGAFAGTSGMSFSGNVGNGEATQETFGSAGQFSSLKFKDNKNNKEVTAEVEGFTSSGSRGTFSGNAGNFGGSMSKNEGFAFGGFGSFED